MRLIGGLPRYLRHPITAVEGLTSVRHGFEQVLPGQFGGGPSDYQLIESKATDGRAVVALRLHPRLGPLDEPAVVAAFIQAIEERGDTQRAMARAWRDGGLVRIERREPMAVGGRKVPHRVQAGPSA